jgi:Carboxypeptidase regulatory-like domain/TonB-dependent Receptor Plug Domain/TonB dependent receptor
MRRLAMFVFIVVFAACAWAQFDTATVLGTVTDPSGAVVPRCQVALHNTATGALATATTDDRGEFRFVDISIGLYELKVTAQGFQPAAAKFELTVGAHQRVDVSLRVATAATTVTTTADVTQLETESSERGQVVNEREIAELPLNGRQYSQLVELTAGVVPTQNQLSEGYTQREGSFNINGLRSVFNNYMLDGLDNNMYGTSNQGFSNQVVQLSPDAVAEFQVVTNNMSSEYGRSGGATINVVTRYGTNQLHGRVWEFLRNTSLDAAGFFKPDYGGKPALHQNQFGGTLGGPIKKDKLFFFLDYEGFRQSSSFTDTATLPTTAERGSPVGGAGLPTGNYIIDTPGYGTGYLPVDNPCPYTGPNGGPTTSVNPCNSPLTFGAGLQDLYPGSTQYLFPPYAALPGIPPSAVIDYAKRVLAELPATTNNNQTNNYIVLHPNTFDRDKGDVKVDYDMRKNLRLFTRYSQARFNAFDPGTIAGPAGEGGDGHVYAPAIQVVGGATWTINPKSLLEVRFGFSRMQAGKTPPLAGGPSMLAQFGITGLPTDPQYTGGITYEYFSNGGMTNLGRLWTSPQYQNPTVWNPKVNYTRILPRHTLKVGLEYTMLHVAQQDLHPVMGGDVYGAQMSGYGYNNNLYYPISPSLSVAGSPAGAQTAQTKKMFDYADFLLGYRTEIGLSNSPVANIREWGWSGYVQDDWKVNQKLTVNLGLRYEYASPLYEANNQLSNFNPTTQTMVLASSSDRYTINPNKKDFGPRVGAAYSLNNKTVLRGGFGISYSHWNRTGSSYLTQNAPFGISAMRMVYPSLPTYLNTESSFPANMVSATNYNPLEVAIQYMPRNSPDTQIQSWFFSVQRDMGHSVLVDLAYVGNRGMNEVFINDINQAMPQLTTCTIANENVPGDCVTNFQSRVPMPNFTSVLGTLPGGTSDYNGLQAKVEKRFTSGLYLLDSFTWSKSIDIAAQAQDGSGGCDNCGNYIPSVQNIYNVQGDRGISANNRPLMNVTSVVWTLPVGKGHWLGGNMSHIWDTALGGWQMTDIFQARSGDPLTMAYSPDSDTQVSPLITISGRNSYRPNQSGPAVATNKSYAGYLNTANFSTPQPYAPFGSSPRNAVRGYAFWQIDTGLTKDFPLIRGAHFQFRAEAFNITNKTNFGEPNTVYNGAGSSTFGVITSNLPARELQMAAKIVF